MSNTEGGSILIGVTDDRTVVGYRRDQGVDDDIHGAAFDASNVGRFEIADLNVGDKTIVVVEVHTRTDDVAYTSDGRVLVRQGGNNRALLPREVAELYGRRARVRFESTDSAIAPTHVDPVSSRTWREHTDGRTPSCTPSDGRNADLSTSPAI